MIFHAFWGFLDGGLAALEQWSFDLAGHICVWSIFLVSKALRS